ncbi:nucleotidyltransferase domain-containing protein [Deinococcus sp.]|uniref:nucleotidyltransferase domain-containing protein n=1 Tax=Deinococcus sp. TaxID=47478 RepID=UPI003CC58F7B
MTRFPDDFRDFLEALRKRQVRFIVAGAFALAAHGHPRYTKDLDVWVEVDPDNAERIVAALHDFGMGSLGLTPADFLSENTIVQLGYEPNRIDLLTSLDGVTFREAYLKRVMLRLSDYIAPVLDLETLKVNKRASGRLRDLADLEELEA